MRDDQIGPEHRKTPPYPRMRLFVTVLYLAGAAIWAGLALSSKGEAQIWSYLLVAIFLCLAAINFVSSRKLLKRNEGPGVDLRHR